MAPVVEHRCRKMSPKEEEEEDDVEFPVIKAVEMKGKTKNEDDEGGGEERKVEGGGRERKVEGGGGGERRVGGGGKSGVSGGGGVGGGSFTITEIRDEADESPDNQAICMSISSGNEEDDRQKIL